MGYLYNDTLDDQLLVERVESFKGGINTFQRATLLEPDVSQDATNLTVLENGRVRTRAGADGLSGAIWSGGEASLGMFYYDTPAAEYLISGFNTAMKKWDGASVTTMAGFVPTADSRLSMDQLVNKLYIADGTKHIQEWDGTNFSDLGTGSPNPPIASILRAHAGRLFATGVAALPDAVYASDLLEAGAGKWNWTDFSFRVGHGEGDPIVGAASMQDFYMLFLKENSLFMAYTPPTDGSGNAITNATAWPVKQLTRGIGCVGKRAFAVVGNDCFFLAQDGVRSVRRMQSVQAAYEVQAPLSEPVQIYIDRINWAAANTTCATSYKQRVFFAVPLDAATSPSHVLVYNSRLNVWEGCWTGWTPRDFAVSRFSNMNRLTFGDSAGYVNQWKDYVAADLDATYTDNSVDIPSSLTVRSFNGGENESTKTPVHFDAIFGQDSNGLVTVTPWLDGTEDGTPYQKSLLTVQNQLPVNLPFNLALGKAVPFRQSTSDLGRYVEIYFVIAQTRLKMEIVAFATSFYAGPIVRE